MPQANPFTDAPFARIGGLPILALGRQDTAELMIRAVSSRRSDALPFYLSSANGEVIARTSQDASTANLFLASDAISADGEPLVIASRLRGKRVLPERVATTDLFHDVARLAQKSGQSFYFLGATQEENARAVAAVRRNYPALKIVGNCHGYLKGGELDAKVAEIAALHPDFLWVALGVPFEQEFAVAYRERLRGVGAIKTSGGLFNFLSGKNKRAPAWMQHASLEWLWRIYQEPRRLFWRYLVTNPVAIYQMARHSG